MLSYAQVAAVIRRQFHGAERSYVAFLFAREFQAIDPKFRVLEFTELCGV